MKILKYKLLFLLAGFVASLHGQHLNDYFLEAAESNPGLRARYAEFEMSIQKVVQVKALPDPTFSFGYFISPVETRVGPQRAKFSLSQMFPWFGTLAVKEKAATLTAEAKHQEFMDARNELYYKVKAAWYPLFEVNRVLQLQKENREILLMYKQLSTTSFKHGKGSMVDVIRTDIMIDNIDTEIKLLEDKKKPLVTVFNNLLNRPDTMPVSIPDSLTLAEVSIDYRKDSLLSSHPKLAAFDLKLQSARAQEEIAVKSGLPGFGVGLDYVIVGNRSDMALPDNGKDVIMPMVSVSLPIFRAKYRAAAEEARLAQVAVMSSKKDFENNLVSAYEMAHYELEKNRELLELYKVQIEKTSQAINLLLTAYSNSGREFEEILRMQQELLKYRIAETGAIKEYFMALAKLDYITAKTE